MQQDFVSYVHTDSCYINIGLLLENYNLLEEFNKFELDKQIKYMQFLLNEITNVVNKKSYNITQKQHYNSQEEEFKIIFEQEKIASAGLFVAKGRCATYTLLNGGKTQNKIDITGLEVIRSDSPEIVKPKILHILKMILLKKNDTEINQKILEFKNELRLSSPENIAENKGINNLQKYLNDDFTWKLKTPHQVKGVSNFNFFVDKFGLKSKYESPRNSSKAKVVYLKKNKFNRTSLTFLK